MEEYNQTRCTHVVDRSKTAQNRKAFEPYQALANRFFEMPLMTFVAPERWRNTTGPVVHVWLIVPKPSRTEKPLKPIQF
jgi:hypothetical protein